LVGILDDERFAKLLEKAKIFWRDEGKPEEFIITANILRRHMRPEKRRECILALLKANPGRSDRAIAKDVGSSKNTVAAVRSEAERRGQIDHVETRTDTKGRSQPASKPHNTSAAAKPNPSSQEKAPAPQEPVEERACRKTAPSAQASDRRVDAFIAATKRLSGEELHVAAELFDDYREERGAAVVDRHPAIARNAAGSSQSDEMALPAQLAEIHAALREECRCMAGEHDVAQPTEADGDIWIAETIISLCDSLERSTGLAPSSFPSRVIAAFGGREYLDAVERWHPDIVAWKTSRRRGKKVPYPPAPSHRNPAASPRAAGTAESSAKSALPLEQP
jgi:hypothetical protein